MKVGKLEYSQKKIFSLNFFFKFNAVLKIQSSNLIRNNTMVKYIYKNNLFSFYTMPCRFCSFRIYFLLNSFEIKISEMLLNWRATFVIIFRKIEKYLKKKIILQFCNNLHTTKILQKVNLLILFIQLFIRLN